MSKYWKWDLRKRPSCSYLMDELGNIIIEVTPECLPSKANAKLIAAAPEMYNALKEAAMVIKNQNNGNCLVSILHALEKAESK